MRSPCLGALGAALVAAAASCATLGEPPAGGPAPFSAVHRIALVRGEPGRARARARDALDALADALAGRRYEVRRVDPAAPEPERRAAERLWERMDDRVGAAPPRARRGRRSEAEGAEAAAAVRALGVDAVVTYHRLEGPPPAAFGDAPAGGGLLPRDLGVGLRRGGGALALVDRDGNATWFAWGGAGAGIDPAEPANAAEAIDMLLGALAGEPEGEER